MDVVVELIAGRFGRVEPRRRVGAYLRGLLAGLERKNGWTLAEHAGAVSPDGMQRLLRTANWDVDGVHDDLRGYVLDQLGDERGVWIVDDTGFVKKGVYSAGVQRQYTAPAGRSTTVSSGCCWPRAVRADERWWIASSPCPRRGPRTAIAARPRGSPLRSDSPPSLNWASTCWPGHTLPGY